MPKGYAIFTEKVTDQAGLNAYSRAAGPTVVSAGGTVLAAGAPAEVIEGDWHGDRTVVLEFESVEAAQAWYNSAGYQAIVGQRHASAESNAVIIGGFELPAS